MSTKLESEASLESTVFGFLRRRLTGTKPLPAGIQLTDQVAIVTGSSVGLGLEASRQLLQLGLSRLIMGVRSQVKGDAAAAQLRSAFPSATISVWTVDRESYDSIRAFADQCATLLRIDIEILNAGFMNTPYTTVAATKHEITMLVNYLSMALLAILLLPILRAKRVAGAARPPVLTLVGSDAAYGADIETAGPVLQQFDKPKAFSQFPWYSKSKLLLVLFVSKLAELVSSDEVLVNMANPGMARGTAFFRGVPTVLLKLVAVVRFLLARLAAVGATTYINAAVAQGKESHGAFTTDWTIKPYPKFCYTLEGKEVREKLWKETLEELNFAGILKVTETVIVTESSEVADAARQIATTPHATCYSAAQEAAGL
ncbi:related to short-chain dehydrogenase/reductase family protein, putative [Phialocephala subalpina]|uniref:Related to short-chain dehydrogenase/reductase family protein, putative n=1 Tax=Phialocephala subalpina TaxID=576137 RepID=A0A1L7WEJ8_9HELO|nr:related to short-chain dehydrogenase/reductase family protein, putative [Phialocephala subalpina]